MRLALCYRLVILDGRHAWVLVCWSSQYDHQFLVVSSTSASCQEHKKRGQDRFIDRHDV